MVPSGSFAEAVIGIAWPTMKRLPSAGEVTATSGFTLLVKVWPADQNGVLTSVPTSVPAVLLISVPVPSVIPQRATRPVVEGISKFSEARICDCVRAPFQIRTSSMKPLK